MENEIEIQTVWRHISEIGHAGYLVWDITEVIGETKPQSYFTATQDKKNVLVQCHHFFTIQALNDYLCDNEGYTRTYQSIIVV